jgi:hypothetical protein
MKWLSLLCIFFGSAAAIAAAVDYRILSPAERNEQLRTELALISGARVRVAGIDPIAALSTLADAVSDLNRRIPTFGPAVCTNVPDGASCLDWQATITAADGTLAAGLELGPGGRICGPFVLRGSHNVEMLVVPAGECLPRET